MKDAAFFIGIITLGRCRTTLYLYFVFIGEDRWNGCFPN